MVNKDLM